MKRKAVYQCSFCLALNTDDSDEIAAGKCYNCEEVDYWEFKGYTDRYLRNIYAEIESKYDAENFVYNPSPPVTENKQKEKKKRQKSWLKKLGNNILIGNRERFARWRWDTFYLLPSISIHIDKGEFCNIDTGRIHNFIDFEIYFDFLFFNALVYPIIMWGDKGAIQEDVW